MGVMDIFSGGFDFMGLITLIFTYMKWAGLLAVVIFGMYWFGIRPKKYPDFVRVKDVTGGGIIVHKTKGGWVDNKNVKGSGAFKLMDHKQAALKHPGLENAYLTKHGKKEYELLKFGAGPYDYAVIPPKIIDGRRLEPIPLSDLDWAKNKTIEAAEKKTLSGFFNEHKGLMVVMLSLVVVLLVMWTFIPAAKDMVSEMINSGDKVMQPILAKQENITHQLSRIADALSGMEKTDPSKPPPGF